jgi:DNA-binding transcriptional LysR family regulator
MELRHLRYFVAVADEQHYGNAAKKIYISQPTISQQIQQLENEIGVELFVRSKRQISRKVELTEAGIAFLKSAKNILELSQKAIDKARKIGLHEQIVRLGIYKIVLRERIVEMIEILKNCFPNVDIKLLEYPNSSDVEQALIDDKLDFGLIILPQKHENLTAKLFKKGRLCVMMHKNHALVNEEYLILDQLKDENWIELNPEIHPFLEQIENACKRVGLNRKKHIVQEVSSLELMSSLVNMGIGIGFISSQYNVSQETNIVVKEIIQDINNTQSYIEINNAFVYKSDKNLPLIKALMASL